MPHDDPQAPATKEDIRLLMEQMGKLYDANSQWKDEIIEHFDLAVETIQHELKAAHHEDVDLLRDRTTDHQKRIERLERHVGFAA